MKIKIVTVGKLKERYLKDGIQEYKKRLGSYCQIELIEVADEKAPEKLSQAEMEQVKDREGKKILSRIKESEYVISLAIEGNLESSESFAAIIDKVGIDGKSSIVFVIGGSLGLSEEVLIRSDHKISFGKMTYPHQLMRLMLIEQVYRAYRINNGHAYHK